MRRLVRATLWTDFRWASGTMIAVVPLVGCVTVEEITGHLVSRRGTLSVPAAWEDVSEFTVGRVVRLELDTTGTEYVELRLREIVDGIGLGGVVTASATGVEYDLGVADKLVQRTVDGQTTLEFTVEGLATVDHVTDHIEPVLPSHITNDLAGAGGPDIDVSYSLDTPLSALLKVAAAAATSSGNIYEVYWRESSGYLLEMGEYVSGSQLAGDLPEIRLRKGARAITRRTSAVDQATRIYPICSDGGGIGDAHFRVEALSTNTYIDIYDTEGVLRQHVVEDDQLNGLYWIHEDGVAHEITDSTTGGRLSMASTTGIAVGEWGRIALDSAGTRPLYIDYPSKQTTYGVIAKVVRVPAVSVTNLVKNHDCAAWTGASPGRPDDWFSGNATKVQTAGLFLTGGTSARITDSTGSGEWVYNRNSINVPSGWTVTYMVVYRVDKSSNLFQITVNDPNGGTQTTALSGVAADQWLTFRQSIVYTGTTGAKNLNITTNCTGTGSSLMWTDRIAIIVAPAAHSGGVPSGSGAGAAWGMATAHLLAHGDPVVTYEVDVLDLYRVDPDGAGEFEELVLGKTVRLVGEGDGLSIDTTERVVYIERNHMIDHHAVVKLTSQRPGFVQMTGG